MHIRSLATVIATGGLILGAWSGAACVGSDPAAGAAAPDAGSAPLADGSSPTTGDGSVTSTDAGGDASTLVGADAEAGVVWSPKDHLPGLAVWLDNRTGLNFDGTAKLTSWVDQSGNGNNGVVTAPCVGPSRAAGSLAGQDTLAFSETGGVGTCVAIADATTIQFGTGDFALFMVARYTNATDPLGAGDSTPNFFSKIQVASPATGVHLFGNTPSEAKLQLWLNNVVGNSVVGATAGLNDNAFHRFGATRRGLDLEVWLEGASNGKITLSSAADLSQVGRPLSLGGVSESSRSSLHGNIAEVIVVKGNVTNAQLAELDAYFKTKHAL